MEIGAAEKKEFLERKIKKRLIMGFVKTISDFVDDKNQKIQSHENSIKDVFSKLYTDEVKNAFYKFIQLYFSQYFNNVDDFIKIRKHYQNLLPVDSIHHHKCSQNTQFWNKDIEAFEQLKGILKTRLDIDDNIINEIFLLLLNQAVLDFYSVKWINTYPIIIKGSLDEFISDCVYNDLIVKNDKAILTSLYFYIASVKGDTQLLPNQKMIDEVNILIKKYSTERKNKQFENFLFSSPQKINSVITIDDVDLMSGFEFENFIKTLFMKMGFHAYNTQKSNDQGIDVIAEKNTVKYGVQCKCYSSTVGNSAIQEVVAGKNYYNCDKVVVVTNSSFTKSAVDLANANNVILWNRDILKEKINEWF